MYIIILKEVNNKKATEPNDSVDVNKKQYLNQMKRQY